MFMSSLSKLQVLVVIIKDKMVLLPIPVPVLVEMIPLVEKQSAIQSCLFLNQVDTCKNALNIQPFVV